MKKVFMLMALIAIGSGLAFADFEFEFGLYGGFGIAGAAGFNMQLGYITPVYKGAAGGTDINKIRWSILADLGIGYRYGSSETYTDYSDHYNENREIKYSDGLDFYLGVITEFYFLPFMGIAIGGGFTPGLGGIDYQPFTPYIRGQIPFLFNNLKIGLGFDYILWKDDDILPPGTNVPPGYRINLLLNLRGDAASGFFDFVLGWFGI